MVESLKGLCMVEKDEFVGIMRIQGEDYVRRCIHVCIGGMVFVQKGKLEFSYC